MKEFPQHELSAAFASMSEKEFTDLCASIKRFGLRDGMDIILFDGQVLDGFHRQRACLKEGRTPRYMDFPDDEDPVAFVKMVNLHRRHLSDSQRASAVVACNKWAERGRPEKQDPGSTFTRPATLKQMAEEAEVSTKTIQRAKTAQEAGLSEKVRDGEMSVKHAAEIAKPTVSTPTTHSQVSPEGGTQALTPVLFEIPPDMVLVTTEENEELHKALTDTLTDNEMMGKVFEADDHLSAAMAEIKKLQNRNDALELRMRGMMNEINEAKRAAKRWKGIADKLEMRVRKQTDGMEG